MDNTIALRTMTIADYPAAAELWKKTAGIGLRSVDDSRAGIEKFLARNGKTCFVAVNAGEELCGVILSGYDGRRGFLYHLAVAENLRRLGAGTALLSAAENALRAEGVTRIALVAYKENSGGNAFWEHHGYAARDDLAYRDKSVNPENT